jgi:hypothetical protein
VRAPWHSNSNTSLLPPPPHLPPRQSDPRRNNWRDVVKAVPGAGAVRVAADASPLSEVMNVAWAVHELVSDQVGETLDFLTQARGGGGAAAKG